MKTRKRDELIVLYGQYVTLLERELATNVTFLNANGKSVPQEDLALAADLTNKIAAMKTAIANEPSDGNRYHDHYHNFDSYLNSSDKEEAKRLIAKAAVAARAEIKRQEAMEIKQLKAEAVTAANILSKNVREELAELASEARVAAKKVTDDAKIAASKL